MTHLGVRRARVGILVLICALAYLLTGLVSPASAHSRLVSSDPADGAALATPPERLSLSFNENLVTVGNEVVVAGPAGPVTVPEPQVAGRDLTVDLPALDAGRYEVNWRAVSADGHPIDGSFAFTVEASAVPTTPAETATETPSPAATPLAEATSEPTSSQTGSGVSPVAVGAGVVILVVVVVGGLLVWRRRRSG